MASRDLVSSDRTDQSVARSSTSQGRTAGKARHIANRHIRTAVGRRVRRRLLLESLERREVLTNSAPLDLTMAGGSILENTAVGAEVAQLSAVDSDPGDTFSFSLVSGTGSTDNSRFAIQSNRLVAQGPFDYETQRQLHVRLRATDAGGLSVERAFTITVLDQDDLAPLNTMTAVSQAEPQYYIQLGGRVETLNPQSVSADGRYYVYAAKGRNLTSGQVDPTANLDVFLYDRTDGSIVLVSHGVDSFSSSADGDSQRPRISADGAYVAFESTAANLVPGQSVPGGTQIYLYNVATRALTLVSRATTAATTPSNGAAQLAGISDDGGRLVFTSNATNLIANQVDSNNGDDVFLYDRATNAVRLVSHSTANAQTAANNRSASAQLSGDGQWVVYASLATNLGASITDTNSADDLWLYSVASTQNALVSHAASSATQAANGGSANPVINRDGSIVAYESLATNLMTGQVDANSATDVFRFRRDQNTSLLVSHVNGTPTTAGNGASSAPSLNADSTPASFTFIAYQSRAKNITPGLGTKVRNDDDVFVWSSDDTTQLVSYFDGGDGSQVGNGRSWQPSISDDGQFVGYLTQATNLISTVTDANGSQADVMVYDYVAGVSGLASHSFEDPSTTGDAGADAVVMAGQGGYVFFSSLASNLASLAIDDRGTRDAFTADIGAGFFDAPEPVDSSDSLAPATTSTGGGNNQLSAYATSADERYWGFTSTGIDLMPDTVGTPPTLGSGSSQVYLFDQLTFARTLVSHAAGAPETAATGVASLPLVSADGAFVAFQSTGTNLVAGQSGTPGQANVFLYDVATGTIQLVSHVSASATASGSGASRPLAISNDGRYVLFASLAVNLVSGQSDANSGEDLFLFDRQTGTVSLVSHAASSTTTTANAPTTAGTMSDDGQLVAFETTATNVVTSQVDSAGTSDVFLYRRATGTSTLVSRSTAGAATAANGASTLARISKSGNNVAFLSSATNLLSGQVDANGGNDAFVYDVAGNSLGLASRAAGATVQTGNGVAQDLAISADGQFVTYSSLATNAVTGQVDTNGAADLFRFDLIAGTALLVTRQPGTATTTAGGGGIGGLAISDDGGVVVYDATTTGLVTNLPGPAGSREVYQFNAANGLTLLATPRPVGSNVSTSRLTGIGSTGETAALTSDSDLLVDWDFNSLTDFFLWASPGEAPNAVPTNIGLSSTQILEQQPVGTVVGTLSTTDASPSDTFFYELTPGPGANDNSFFTIAGTSLKSAAVFNQATKSTYNIRVRSTDAAGDFVDKTFIVQVTSSSAGPTDLSLDKLTVTERVRGATVGNVTVTNSTPGATHVLSVNDTRFTFSGNTLKLKTTDWLNRSTATTVTVTITATDNAIPAHSYNESFTLTVTANPTPWQNPTTPLDVFPDTFVVAQDALFVINELNATGPHDLTPPLETDLPLSSYYDTDGDNAIAPIDALLVINFLNAESGGEGEAPASLDTETSLAIDSMFAASSGPRGLLSNSEPPLPAAAGLMNSATVKAAADAALAVDEAWRRFADEEADESDSGLLDDWNILSQNVPDESTTICQR